MNAQASIPDPDLRALLNAHLQEVLAQINCAQVGRVVSFDRDAGSASVQILAKRVVFNKVQEGGALQQTPNLVDYPVLTDVPVHFPSGGGAILSMPIAAGDVGVLLFNDRDLDAWWQAGGANVPNSGRLHSLSDAMFLPGLFAPSNPLPEGTTGDDVILTFGGAVIKITPAGAISITAVLGNNVTVLADGTVQITGIGQVNVTALDVNKIRINNGILSLKTALDDLMTVLLAWINTGGSTPNPATIAALTVVKTEIDSLLA